MKKLRYLSFTAYLTISFLMLVLMSCGKSSEEYIKEANDALSNGDFATAYEIIDIMKSDYWSDYDKRKAARNLNSQIVNNEIASIFEDPSENMISSKVIKILKERFTDENDYDYIKSNLVMSINMAMESGREDLIVDFLTQIPIRGERKEGLQSKNDGKSEYISDCVEFNKICDQILDKSLSKKQFELAEDIVGIYKEDCRVVFGSGLSEAQIKMMAEKTGFSEEEIKVANGDQDGSLVIDGVTIDGSHCFITYDWQSKNAANSRLAEAKK